MKRMCKHREVATSIDIFNSCFQHVLTVAYCSLELLSRQLLKGHDLSYWQEKTSYLNLQLQRYKSDHVTTPTNCCSFGLGFRVSLDHVLCLLQTASTDKKLTHAGIVFQTCRNLLGMHGYKLMKDK
jgi:hypothetical protein